MPALATQDVINYVLSFVDVDSTDIPPSLATAWIQSAYDDLIGADIRWPFFEVGGLGSPYTVTTVAGQQSYALPAVTVAGHTATATVSPKKIIAVQGPHWELLYHGQTALESTFTPAFIVSQEPERYSLWGNTGLTLWPIPNAAYTLNVRAYREPVDFISEGVGATIDAPSDFHSAIRDKVLSYAWAQQTDLQQSSYWDQMYEQAKARLVRKYLRAPLPENLRLNGGGVTRELPPRLRFPFESLGGIGSDA